MKIRTPPEKEKTVFILFKIKEGKKEKFKKKCSKKNTTMTNVINESINNFLKNN